MKMRKFAALMLTLCMMLSLSISAFAASDTIASGTIPDSKIKWELDSHGWLTISGSGEAPGPSAEPGADSFHQTASRQDGKAGAAGGIPVIESESPYLSFAPVSCKIEQILQFERSPPRRSGGLSCSGSN